MVGLFDIHCHVLPGIDDGARDAETAAALLKKEYQDGVRTVIATPHYRKNMFEPPMERILEVYGQIKSIAADIGIQLYLGCEYHANMDMADALLRGERPTLAGSRYVLCEFSHASEQRFIRDRIYQLISSGFIPVLAHIERYPALTGDFDFIEELSEMGGLMQVNAGSILGEDGFRVKRFCRKLIDYDLLDVAASDCHDMKQRTPRLGELAAYFEKKYGSDYAERILLRNPERMIQNT